MKKHTWLWIPLLLVLLLSCTLPGLGKKSAITNHTMPDLSIDMTPFEEAGCTADSYGIWTCPEGSSLADFECDRIETPAALLGGLEPADALALCWIMPFQHADFEEAARLEEAVEQEGYIYADGCMLPTYARYIVAHDGTFELLANPEAFQAHFGEVTSYDEALSYALATTNYYAAYGLEAEPSYRYLVDELEDTYVLDNEENGYIVHLYSYQFCGCGPHTTSTIDIIVTRDGEVLESGLIPAYEDPAEDDLCID